MSKFKVRKSHGTTYYISDGDDHHMHSDGKILSTTEFWPTHEQAQAVLDKFRPEHEWVHGDVFTNAGGHNWIYVTVERNSAPIVICLHSSCGEGTPSIQLGSATFLFNIKGVLSDRGLA